MAHRKTKQYTKEFRDGVVQLVLKGTKTAAQLSRELKVPKGTIASWMDQVRTARGEEPTVVGEEQLSSTEKQEWLRLRRENERLKMERDILKKAAAFFAKESS
jgi:transposase